MDDAGVVENQAVGPLTRLKRGALLQLWSRSTKSFVYGSGLKTIDEHDANSQKEFPKRDDIELFWKVLDSGDNNWTIKHRQGMVSWALRASDLRVALFRPNSKIALVFDDKDDGIDHIENRIKPMFESLQETHEWFWARFKLRKFTGAFIVESCDGKPWRSIIEPIARGNNKLRSRTYTRIDWEEAATQDWMETAYMGAKPTVQGRKDLITGETHKGQIVIVSTPIPDTYFLKLGGAAVDTAVQVARGELSPRKFFLAEANRETYIDLPIKGMSTWKNEYNYTCLAWHWSADLSKDEAWVRRESAEIPGGVESDNWQQEQEMNTKVLRGRATYWAFDVKRNVIEHLPVSIEEMRKWTIFLSADFGATDATCWLFWAEDPETKTLVVFDEVYVDDKYKPEQRVVGNIKRMVYDRLRHFFGIGDEHFRASSYIRYAIGDPSGKGYMQEYASEPLPIPVGRQPEGIEVKVNDRLAGENRLNSFFAPQFFCCGQIYYHEFALCEKCSTAHKGRPRLIITSNCTHLIEQLPRMRKAVPKNPELEISDRDVKVADHAVDSAKYGALTRPIRGAQTQNFQKRWERPVEPVDARFMTHLDGVYKKALEQQAAHNSFYAEQNELAIEGITQYYWREEDEDDDF